MRPTIVIDTSVFIAALLSEKGRSREVLRGCLKGQFDPVMGTALFTEFEAVMSRAPLFARCPVSALDRQALLEAFLGVCRWVNIYYLWRPNLPDEGDNHVLELAVAAGAEAVVTHNPRDFRRAELNFPDVAILTPDEFLRKVETYGDNDDQIGG